jgi:glutathione S-transferase
MLAAMSARSDELEQVEIHGYVTCPFAWRVRLAAAEKGIAAAWIPSDVDAPDPRSAAHNPEEHSPLLWHQGFALLESEVIMTYVDEAAPGRPLMPAAARARAELRLLAIQLRSIDVHMERSRPEARKRSAPALAALDAALGERTFLHDEQPGYVDLLVWPFLADLYVRRLEDGSGRPRVAAYLARMWERPSFLATRPPWALLPSQ